MFISPSLTAASSLYSGLGSEDGEGEAVTSGCADGVGEEVGSGVGKIVGSPERSAPICLSLYVVPSATFKKLPIFILPSGFLHNLCTLAPNSGTSTETNVELLTVSIVSEGRIVPSLLFQLV